MATELGRLKVDVLGVGGTPAAHAAKKVTRSIPIVMTYVANPVGTGLVTTLARRGETARDCLTVLPAWW